MQILAISEKEKDSMEDETMKPRTVSMKGKRQQYVYH